MSQYHTSIRVILAHFLNWFKYSITKQYKVSNYIKKAPYYTSKIPLYDVVLICLERYRITIY